MKTSKVLPVVFSLVLSFSAYGQQTIRKDDQKPPINETNTPQIAKPVFSNSAIKNAISTVEEMNKELNLNDDYKQKLIDIIAEKNNSNILAMKLSEEERVAAGTANFYKYIDAINKTFGSELAAKIQQAYSNYVKNQRK